MFPEVRTVFQIFFRALITHSTLPMIMFVCLLPKWYVHVFAIVVMGSWKCRLRPFSVLKVLRHTYTRVQSLPSRLLSVRFFYWFAFSLHVFCFVFYFYLFPFLLNFVRYARASGYLHPCSNQSELICDPSNLSGPYRLHARQKTHQQGLQEENH